MKKIMLNLLGIVLLISGSTTVYAHAYKAKAISARELAQLMNLNAPFTFSSEARDGKAPSLVSLQVKSKEVVLFLDPNVCQLRDGMRLCTKMVAYPKAVYPFLIEDGRLRDASLRVQLMPVGLDEEINGSIELQVTAGFNSENKVSHYIVFKDGRGKETDRLEIKRAGR